MFGSSYKIATVAGIPIRIHISLLLIVLILIGRFGLIAGLVLEAGLLVSIVMHELGHSIVAIRKGCKVREITLMFIGGAAQMETIPTRPLDEFLMAITGPAVSLVLGLAGVYFGGLLTWLPPVGRIPLNMIQLLGGINLGLVIFNLLPAFPMDGGRVLRAALTRKFGRLRATFIAARVGKIMAVLFGIHGFFESNWLLVFIAFFVFISAGAEYNLVVLTEAARKRRAYSGSFEDVYGSDEVDDRVVVGPPPYAKGADGYTTDIRGGEEEW